MFTMSVYPNTAIISSLMLCVCVLLLSTTTGHPIGLDGFETDPCLRLGDFAIDGNWWAESDDEVDWSSVLQGTRTTSGDVEYKSTQNQCIVDRSVRYGFYYDAGLFCDTFDNNEASHLATGTKHELDATPRSWVPLIETSMQDKGDLTNAYYVGSSLDLIICAAFERIDTNGVSYMDIEFNQKMVDDQYATVCYEAGNNAKARSDCRETCHQAGYDDVTGKTYARDTTWKCRYVDRVATDIQISFEIANDMADAAIVVSEWDPVNEVYSTIRKEILGAPTAAEASTYYESPDNAFRAAVNSQPINASSFGYICDDKDPNKTYTGGCPIIEDAGVFFEACIDFKPLGFRSLHFESLIVKSRASPQGSYKDTSGPLWHTICGPENCDGFQAHDWNYPRSDKDCNMSLTPFPTWNPTSQTVHPTTAQPTVVTTIPTATPSMSPTSNTSSPTQAPTNATGAPTPGPTISSDAPTEATDAPTRSTSAPTSTTTLSPTRVSSQPTGATPGPTPGPTVVRGQPSQSPTRKPSRAPTPGPTVPEGSPSRPPTAKPSRQPTPMPSTDPSPAPTATRGCSSDLGVFRTECTEAVGAGCSAQFTYAVNVCKMNKRFTRPTFFETFKVSVIEIWEATPSYIGLCDTSDVRIEAYAFTYADDAAESFAQTAECGGCDTDTYPVTIGIEIGMYCGDCDKLQRILNDYEVEKDLMDRSFGRKLKAVSIPKDGVCNSGFGGVTVVSGCAVYRDENGAVVGESSCEGVGIGLGDDDTEEDDDMAATHCIAYGLVLVAVLAAIVSG